MNGTFRVRDNAKKQNKIPWLMLALGFAFILNPNITIIDPLPDFFGYIIISVALTKLSMLCETLLDAKRAFEKMILIDGGKTLVIIWVFGIDSVSERASSLLLWSFVFGVLEAIFLIPSYLKLFKGLSELGDYHPNSSIHASGSRRKKSYTDSLKIFTVIFIVFKAFMTVLPELADLSNASYDETSVFVNLYRYIGIMRFLACLPVLVVGIAWFSNIWRYFRRISKDKELNESLSKQYELGVLPRNGLFVIKRVKTASWLLIAAAVLTLDFTLEGIAVVPDVLVLAALIPAFAYLCKTTNLKKTATYILCGAYGISAILTYVLNWIYLENYTYSVMDKDATAFTLYLSYVIAVAVQGVLFICMLSAIVKQLQSVVSAHTGYVVGKEIQSEGEQKRIAEVHKEINKCFSLALDFAVVYVISDVVYALYGAIYAFMRADAGYLNIVNIACGLLFVGMTVRAVDALKEAVQTKYMLE